MNKNQHKDLNLLEAIIFASSEPVSERVLSDKMPDGCDLESLLVDLKKHYQNRGVNLKQVGKSWAFRTSPEIANALKIERTVTRKLSRAAIETLAICAYHQPVTRAEIEEIRGVGLSKGTMDVLFEAGWIRPRGRRQSPGKPVTWGTTEGFLDQFGMDTIDDLPGMDELKAAGLIDKRPAIQTLATRGEMESDSSSAEQPDNTEIEPLDPDESEHYHTSIENV